MNHSTTDLTDLDMRVAEAIGVWHDLERALVGKNGYGGDVAEIYTYRLVSQRLRDATDPSFITGATEAEEQIAKVEAAKCAGKNMTRLLRRFVDLHEGVIFSIEGRDGYRPLDLATEEFPPFDWRVHLRVTQTVHRGDVLSIHELRDAIVKTASHANMLTAMLDELAALRAKDSLHAAPQETASTADLPPDGVTGLYLDRPFDVEDLEVHIPRHLDPLSREHGSGPTRSAQLMLVFQAISRDDRTSAEFLRVMNTIILPLCRRVRLKAQLHLSQLGSSTS